VTGAERIERSIRQATAAGRPALAPFLTAGYPSRDGFAELVVSVAGAADVLEIGVPFTDPMADGVTIQRSSQVALAAGVDLGWILRTLGEVEARVSTPVVLMSYLNPLLAYGLERVARDAAAAGVAGFIVPDLPLEESGEFRENLESEGLALIQMVTPVTAADRLERICRAGRGFVYAVTATGITGGRVRPSAEYLQTVREASPVPVLAGFGIRSSEQLREVAAHVDGGVVGSALIEALDRGEDPVRFLEGLRRFESQEVKP
jgi:tryptophan synthase alpha chain